MVEPPTRTVSVLSYERTVNVLSYDRTVNVRRNSTVAITSRATP